MFAGVAQLVEQLIRNQQVTGSSPVTSSKQKREPQGSLFLKMKGSSSLWIYVISQS